MESFGSDESFVTVLLLPERLLILTLKADGPGIKDKSSSGTFSSHGSSVSIYSWPGKAVVITFKVGGPGVKDTYSLENLNYYGISVTLFVPWKPVLLTLNVGEPSF